ncbi:MAG: DHHA1 domain-containing protein [Elusimicrobiota bacterium]
MKVITTHSGADFDALSSLLAASKLYPGALMFLPGSPEKKVREYLENEDFPGALAGFNDIKSGKLSLLVITDTRFENRLGRIGNMIHDDTEIHIFDHHPRTDKDMTGTVDVLEKYGATTTILVNRIIASGIRITPDEATLMVLGIYEDTGCLTYPLTTPADVDVVSFLLKNGADLSLVSRYVIHEVNEKQLDLLNTFLESKRVMNNEAGMIVFVHAEITDYVEELAIVVHKTMDILKPDVLFALVKIGSRILCISRSRSKKADVGKILGGMGGGGHPTAASVTFEGISMEEALVKLRGAFKKDKRNETRKSRSMRIIRKAARVIPSVHTCSQAYHTLNHLDMKYAPVGADNGKLYGIAERVELEKAVRHGFSEHPVTEFITKQVPSVSETDSEETIADKMTSCGFPFLILRDKDGIVSGLVEHAFTELDGQSSNNISVSNEFVLSKLENNLGKRVVEIIRIAAGIAADMNMSAYCVGGMVRDILMDIKHKDIDIVVEKDGIEFARRLSEKLGGRLSGHEKFKTAVVKTAHRAIDIATLRKEYYEFPAALPEVEGGTLQQDLYRRDFTVNSMAVQINPENEYGKLIDYFKSRDDLEGKTIRILYPLSFIEDPTRIFRAVRFEKRFNFSIAEDTLIQLKKTVHMDIHSALTNDRVKEEIILILEEDKPHEILSRLGDLGVLSCIHNDLEITQNIYSLMEECGSMAAKIPGHRKKRWQINRWKYLLMIIISELDVKEGERILEEFHFSKDYIHVYLKAKESAVRIIRLLGQHLSRARIYKSLHSIEEDVLFYIFCICRNDDIRNKILLYMEELKPVEPNIDGIALIEMGYSPGPLFSEILHMIKTQKINGKLNTRREENEYVMRNYPKI